ncbi:MAG TPA: hypothetical protein G4O11_02220 [Anaerolineae bacterium]|nr:MAG: hypothetical protein AMJ88_18105 [Anaerolineae bacterium SM23_ 63]HEY42776.1 hypothetical protein [Anaerolineae bacterium]
MKTSFASWFCIRAIPKPKEVFESTYFLRETNAQNVLSVGCEDFDQETCGQMEKNDEPPAIRRTAGTAALAGVSLIVQP